MIGRIGHGSHELNAIDDAELGGQAAKCFAVTSRADQDQVGRNVPRHFLPGCEQERQVFLRVQPAREDDSRAGKQVSLERTGPGMKVAGVHAAGQPGNPTPGNAQLQPLALDLGGDCRQACIAEDDAAQQGRPTGAAKLVGLAVVARVRPAAPGSESPAARSSARPVATASQSAW